MTEITPEPEKVKQANSLVQARYDLSAWELNIFILMLYEMKLARFEKNYYQVSLEKLAKYTPGLNITHVKDAAEKLSRRTLKIQNGEKWLVAPFVSSCEYLMGYLEIGVDSKLLKHYQDLEKYTVYELQTALSVRSKYTKRIYQLISQYKHLGHYITRVDELKMLLGLINEKTGKEEYKMWTSFKERVLDVAKRELFETGELAFTWRVHQKQGKKITHLYFEIIKTAPEKKTPPDPQVIDYLTKTLKLVNWQAERIAERVSPPDIEVTINNIKNAYRLGQVRNIGAYSAMTFDNHFKLGFKNGAPETEA